MQHPKKVCLETLFTPIKADLALRFQKMVELAPSTIQNRDVVNQVIQSAVQMAKAVSRGHYHK